MDVLQSYISPARIGSPAAPRGKAAAFRNNPVASSSRHSLIVFFAAWKTLLLLAAILSPGPGYDTSSQILARQYGPPVENWFGRAAEQVALKLTRWDAIYYASIAERGYVHEQEWAFGGAFGRLPALFAPAFFFLPSSILRHALSGICLSHLFHLLGVLALFQLTFDLFPAANSSKRFSVAFTAASLHVVSPAGLFLSAPYSESAFAFWTFAGTAAYVSSIRDRFLGLGHGTRTIVAGIFFGLAAATRSNGLFAGLIFLLDTFSALSRPRSGESIRTVLPTLVAGALIAVGFATPQTVGYITHCTGGRTRPWCNDFPPSIYRWVQSHYWDVGFLRYWTPNNIPLFALAAPMLAWLTYTGVKVIRFPQQLSALMSASDVAEIDDNFVSGVDPGGEGELKTSSRTRKKNDTSRPASIVLQRQLLAYVLPRLALPQLTLVVLAATSFHVQIVNRLASAYPVWYILLAVVFHCEPSTARSHAPDLTWLCDGRRASVLVRVMIIYAVVQGGLFASFLPPA